MSNNHPPLQSRIAGIFAEASGLAADAPEVDRAAARAVEAFVAEVRALYGDDLGLAERLGLS